MAAGKPGFSYLFHSLSLRIDEGLSTLREVSVDIAGMSLHRLRTAIQNSEVSFPSQVPVFVGQSRADIQWRLVELYFIHNWSCDRLGERYGVAMERIRQLLTRWVRRAAAVGYLQEIPANVTHADVSGIPDSATIASVRAAAAAIGGAQ